MGMGAERALLRNVLAENVTFTSKNSICNTELSMQCMKQQKVLHLCCAPAINAFCYKTKQQISIHAMHIFGELEKLFLEETQEV